MIKIEQLDKDTTRNSSEENEEDKNSIVKCDETIHSPPVKKIKSEPLDEDTTRNSSQEKEEDTNSIVKCDKTVHSLPVKKIKSEPLDEDTTRSSSQENQGNKNSIDRCDETVHFPPVKKIKSEPLEEDTARSSSQENKENKNIIVKCDETVYSPLVIKIKSEPLDEDTTRSSSQENEENKNSIVECDENVHFLPVKKIKSEQINLSLPPTQSGIMPNSWTYISLSNDGTSFKEGVTDKMEGLPDDAGKWMIFIDREFSISAGSLRDYAWKIAKRLVMDFGNTGIISAKCSTKWSSNDSKGVICCYTADYNDKQSVKRAAEAIRKAYPKISDFYYKTESDSHRGNYRKNGNMAVTKYKYSRNKFYERGKYLEWELVNEASQATSINYVNQSSTTTDEENSYEDTDYDSDEHTESKWTYISSSNDGKSFKEGVTDEMEGLPEDAGKWIMFNDGDFCAFSGMSHQNYAWEIVKKLVKDFRNTGIISAKCSTTWDSENSYFMSSPKGVICCYTADYKDKQCVKKAVETIRKACPYALDMYYETEEDSYLEDYRHYSNEDIAKYKYTVGKKFYEMGEDYRWHLVDEPSQLTSISYARLSSSMATQEIETDSKLHLSDKTGLTTSIKQENLSSAITTHEIEADSKWHLVDKAGQTTSINHANLSSSIAACEKENDSKCFFVNEVIVTTSINHANLSSTIVTPEKGTDFKRNFVNEASQVASINLQNASSTIATYGRGKESKMQSGDKDNQTASINRTRLPSTITTHEWLYISCLSGNQETLVWTSEDIKDLPPDSGKWLLFHNKSSICPSVNMSHHDYAWQVLKSLVIDYKNSGIIAAKSSTSKRSNKYSDSQGVICCYTENFNDVLDVKKAADAIRKVYRYPSTMYYKTEESTISGIYSKRTRGNRVSIYQHFENNTMYERDCGGPWQPIIY